MSAAETAGSRAVKDLPSPVCISARAPLIIAAPPSN